MYTAIINKNSANSDWMCKVIISFFFGSKIVTNIVILAYQLIKSRLHNCSHWRVGDLNLFKVRILRILTAALLVVKKIGIQGIFLHVIYVFYSSEIIVSLLSYCNTVYLLTYLDTWSGFEAAKTAPWPSQGFQHFGKFLEPSDEWAGRGCYCLLMRWHS